ncbi:MAG: 30S ribosomal protein S17, partial [Dehalococcoidia bacterium]
IIRRVRRFKAHDEAGSASLGDRVRIVEGKPISRHKHWQVVEVLERVELLELAPAAIDLELLGEVKTEEKAVEAPPQEEPKAEEAPAAEATVAEEATQAEPATGEEKAEEVMAGEEATAAGDEGAAAESGEEERQ